jgi:hypothetical protein
MDVDGETILKANQIKNGNANANFPRGINGNLFRDHIAQMNVLYRNIFNAPQLNKVAKIGRNYSDNKK